MVKRSGINKAGVNNVGQKGICVITCIFIILCAVLVFLICAGTGNTGNYNDAKDTAREVQKYNKQSEDAVRTAGKQIKTAGAELDRSIERIDRATATADRVQKRIDDNSKTITECRNIIAESRRELDEAEHILREIDRENTENGS